MTVNTSSQTTKGGKRHSILGLLPLFKEIEEQGKDPEVLLKKSGIDLDKVTGGALIDEALELEIISDAIDLVNDPILGIKVGSQVSFTSYGTFAMLLMSANTLGDAVKSGYEFQSLSLLLSDMTVHYDRDWVELRYIMPNVPAKLKDFVAERDLMGTYVFIKEFLDEPGHKLLQLGITRSKPEDEDFQVYKRLFRSDVTFDQPYNWIRLPSRLLRVEQKHRNSWAHKLYRMQAYELLRVFTPENDDIVSRVQQILVGYEQSPPQVTEVAGILGLSERTLRRKLEAEGESFRSIVDQYRKKRTLSMMAQGTLAVNEIASAVGFAETASFLRAFKRWTGTTPKQYLKRA